MNSLESTLRRKVITFLGIVSRKIYPENLPFLKSGEHPPVPLTIVIPAFRAGRWIEECLDSVERQNYFRGNDDFEVLVGVDNCRETLEKLCEIRGHYRNLRVFFFRENTGAYIVRNTLVYAEAKHENIIFFDADDIMRPTLAWLVGEKLRKEPLVRFQGTRFPENPRDSRLERSFRLLRTNPAFLYGIFGIRRKLFFKFGGFQPWPCEADSEFFRRTERYRVPAAVINESLAEIRKHPESLTMSRKTGTTSDLRRRYRKLSAKTGEKYVEPVFGQYDEAGRLPAGQATLPR